MNLLHSTGQSLTPNHTWHSHKQRGNLQPLLARVRPCLVLLLTLLLTSVSSLLPSAFCLLPSL